MVESRRNSSPSTSEHHIATTSSTTPAATTVAGGGVTTNHEIESKSTGCLIHSGARPVRKHGGSCVAFLIDHGGESSSIMTGVNAAKSTSETAGSASPTVWRKSSHPPLHFNNNETRNRNLQLQLKNRGTKDDWGASLRYDIEETPSVTKLDQLPDIISISSDSTVPTPTISPSVYERFMTLSDNLTALVKCIMDEAKQNTNAESMSSEEDEPQTLFKKKVVTKTKIDSNDSYKKLAPSQIIEFITAVEMNEELWNICSSSYKDTSLVNVKWLELERGFNFLYKNRGYAARRVWNSLKIDYQKERARMKSVPSGSSPAVANFEYSDEMGFLETVARSKTPTRCSLFLIDEEKNELAAKVFDHGGADGIGELRVPMGDGVVGRVAKTRTMMNVRDAMKCPFFYANVDELTGYQTRNILCFPIIDNSGVLVGVTELCNKIVTDDSGSTVEAAAVAAADGEGFTRTDEKYAKQFAIYCANSISHCLFYKKIQEAQTRCHMATEMYVQGAHIKIKDEEVVRLLNDPLRDWRYFNENFDSFSFAPRMIGENHFHKASMMFFEDLGFTMRFRMNKRKLSYLVLRISEGYRSVPYHNWSHAFAVAHFCWLMMRTESCRSALDELERLSMLIACLCHDIDHRGTTNSFQLQSKTPLAQLYSSEGSVLERHHYAQTVSILHMPECDILEQLTAGQYRTVLSNIREVILATDIAAHLKKASRIHDMVDAGYNPISTDHHYLLTCLIMTASDLSDQSKNFRNAKMIAENIYLEFFAQGDLEAELGVKPLEMMDREKAYVPQVQLEFLDSIGVPVFEMLAAIIPDGKSTFEAIKANRMCWKALHEEMSDSSAHIKHGLTYLRDEDVERRVFERVSRIDEHAAQIAAKTFEPPVLVSNGNIPLSLPNRCIFEGYHEQYQQNSMSLLFRANHEMEEDDGFVPFPNEKLNSVTKVTEEAAVSKPIDIGCEVGDNDVESGGSAAASTGGNRRRSRTPRRLWRRARRLMSSVSSSCTSCSPLSSRRQQSKENQLSSEGSPVFCSKNGHFE